MALITAFNSARMLEIENSSVTAGFVDVNGHLLLTRHNGEQIDAGDVVGPQGIQGPPGADAIIPPQFGPNGLQITDWNDALTTGFYWGNAAANQPIPQTVDVDYWVGHVQVMLTTSGITRVLQTAWRADVPGSPVYSRTFNAGGSGVWSAWAGIESGYGSTNDLGTLDLDTITTPGTYYQSTIVNGTLARHYPHASAAGLLEVFNFNNASHVYQRFTRRGDNPYPMSWMRGKYTSGAWQPWSLISQYAESWTDLTGYLATGITYTPDSGVPGCAARRVGMMVEIYFANLTIDTLSVPTSGNISNKSLMTGIPSKFRPEFIAGISPGPAGGLWTGYITNGGTVAIGSYMPPVTATATANYTNHAISGTAFYPAATFF